jgi:hypothetical protein
MCFVPGAMAKSNPAPTVLDLFVADKASSEVIGFDIHP